MTNFSVSGKASLPTYRTRPQCIRRAKKKKSTDFFMEKSNFLKKCR